MNKKDLINNKNISNLAEFLIKTYEIFKNGFNGCYKYNLDQNLAVFVGWSYGYEKDCKFIISGGDFWGLNVGIKCRCDSDFSDYDALSYPWDKRGECWIVEITPTPNDKKRKIRKDARYLLGQFIEISKAHEKGLIIYE